MASVEPQVPQDLRWVDLDSPPSSNHEVLFSVYTPPPSTTTPYAQKLRGVRRGGHHPTPPASSLPPSMLPNSPRRLTCHQQGTTTECHDLPPNKSLVGSTSRVLRSLRHRIIIPRLQMHLLCLRVTTSDNCGLQRPVSPLAMQV